MLNRLVYWFRWSYRPPLAVCPDCHKLERVFWVQLRGHDNCLPF